MLDFETCRVDKSAIWFHKFTGRVKNANFKNYSNTLHTLAVLLFFSLVYALSCDCCGLCNRQWWHDTFCKRRIVYHELLLGGWQDRLPLQKSLHTHCKGSPSRPNVRWWLIRFSQIMMLCLSPFQERVSVINGKNTKYKKTKSALIKVGGWTSLEVCGGTVFFCIFDLFLVILQSLHPQLITSTFLSHVHKDNNDYYI